MKYNIIQLTNEHALNKVIGQHKRDKQRLDVLFMSEWCAKSAYLWSTLLDQDVPEGEGHPLYVVDSWNTPHAFQIWRVTSAPTLVRIDPVSRNGRGPNVRKHVSITDILHVLRLEDQRPKRPSRKKKSN